MCKKRIDTYNKYSYKLFLKLKKTAVLWEGFLDKKELW